MSIDEAEHRTKVQRHRGTEYNVFGLLTAMSEEPVVNFDSGQPPKGKQYQNFTQVIPELVNTVS
uniref:Uncharacterized protein n=1 Tax=Moorena producens (strain JHB) TaxID=1454205 RepID=A0A1D9G5G2_MOOP1